MERTRCVSGWAALHEKFGKLPFARLLEPTIHQAREGFPVSAHHRARLVVRHLRPPGPARRTYLPDGQPVSCGTIFKNPDLAGVLETLARHGPKAFYEGDIAARMVKFSQSCEGRFSLRRFPRS